MNKWTSLFAQKLRAHRVCMGHNGRMTQEELATALGVSVDAVSKYERSLSYIRGDLEFRLVDTLGWSQDTVLACREDWEDRPSNPQASPYRLLTNEEALNNFNGSPSALSQALADMETGGSAELPSGFSAGDTIWSNLQRAGCVSGPYVLYGSELVGHVGLIFPGAELETRFYDRDFDEGEITSDQLKRPILPGKYFAYCPAIYIARGHEAAARSLLSGFVTELEELADREVLVREIGAISVNALGKQLCEDLGLRFYGQHRHYPDFGVWIMPGQDIASSILGRRSSKLRQVYDPRKAGAERP